MNLGAISANIAPFILSFTCDAFGSSRYTATCSRTLLDLLFCIGGAFPRTTHAMLSVLFAPEKPVSAATAPGNGVLEFSGDVRQALVLTRFLK